MDNKSLKNESTILSIITSYYEMFPTMEIIPVNIITTDNLNRTHCELRPEYKNKFLGANAELGNEDNGRMVVPHSINETISILLNSKKLKEYAGNATTTWIGTIAHELTHAIDYYQIARKDGLYYYDPLEDTALYHMFQLWSEFHARKLGYHFLRKVISKSNDSEDEQQQIEYILKTRYNRACLFNIDENRHIYNTMQLLGRYSVWCDLFPATFNEEALSTDFLNSAWIAHLLSFLRKHDSLDLIYYNFDELRCVLSEKWSFAK